MKIVSFCYAQLVARLRYLIVYVVALLLYFIVHLVIHFCCFLLNKCIVFHCLTFDTFIGISLHNQRCFYSIIMFN